MTTELWLLVMSVALGLVHVIAASHLISWQRGYRWTASSREDDVAPLRGLASRVVYRAFSVDLVAAPRVPQRPSAFHPHASRTAFRGGDARQQTRLCALVNPTQTRNPNSIRLC